ACVLFSSANGGVAPPPPIGRGGRSPPPAPTSAVSSSRENPYPEKPNCTCTNHTNGSRLNALNFRPPRTSRAGSGYQIRFLPSNSENLVKSVTQRHTDLIM